jgi:hypothetical protein
VAWAKRYTVFKPFSEQVLMERLQVWTGQEWQWVAREG